MDVCEREKWKKRTEKDRSKEIESFDLIFDIHKLYQKSQGSKDPDYQSQNQFNRSCSYYVQIWYSLYVHPYQGIIGTSSDH